MKRHKKYWPVLLIFLVWLILFRNFFFKGLLPIPADITVGMYYPWLDYKWGYAVGVPVKNPLLSDVPSILYPWRTFAIDELKAGRLPLWNPYYFAGMPLLANFQSAVFSYVNIFFWFVSQPIAWSLGVMMSPLLTMAAMYKFLRHKALSVTPSLFGSVVFALSGFQVAWLEYNVHGHTALFLPLLLFSIDKIIAKEYRWLFGLALLVAAQIFTGYIPIVIYSYLVCICYLIFFHLFPRLKDRTINFKAIILTGLFFGWGLLLASVQLLPGIQLTLNSIRKIDETVLASEASYLPLRNLVTLLAPDFFGNPVTGNFFGLGFYDNFYFFAGTGTVILVVLSLLYFRKNRQIVFWWFILLFSFVLVIRNPIGELLGQILSLSGGVAAKALFITDFALAVLAGLGMEIIVRSMPKAKLKILASVLVVMAVFAFTYRFSFSIDNPVNRLVAQRNMVIPAFVLLASSIMLLIGLVCQKVAPKVIGFFFCFITAGQLLYSANKYLPFSKSGMVFPSIPVIDYLQKDSTKSLEPFRVELGKVVSQNFLMPYQIETGSGYDTLLPLRMGEFLSILRLGTIDRRISRVQLIENYTSPLFLLMNTKYLLAKKQDEKGYFRPEGKPPDQFLTDRYNKVFEDKTVQVYEDKNYLPRAFFVKDYRVINAKKELVAVMTANIDFSKTVILEEDPEITLSKSDSMVKPEVAWLKNQPGYLQLKVNSPVPNILVIANNFDPGWKVNINGLQSKLFRADYTFQAVKVAAGEQIITMSYFPAIVRFSAITSGLSLFVLLLVYYWSVKNEYL